MTQRIEYTEEMVGNAHPTKADTLNRPINIITTAGDMLYGTAAATVARLAKGPANTKLFMNPGATAPEWALGSSVITDTRSFDAATGTQAFTGAGFQPSACVLFSLVTNTGIGCIALIGADTNIVGLSNFHYSSPGYWGVGALLREDAGKYQTITFSSFEADGVNLGFTRTGVTAAGTITTSILCFR